MKFHHFNEDFRTRAVQSHEKLIEMRRIVDEFCHQIRELSGFGTEMPLRKIEAAGRISGQSRLQFSG